MVQEKQNITRTRAKVPIFIAIVVIALAIIAAIAWTMRTGKLSVKSIPAGCQLELNGNVMDGKAPMVLPPLRCGEYQLKLTHPGYHDWTGTATVNWRSVTDVTGELKPILTTGFIKVDSSPEGARIILDGTDTKQKTPVTLGKVKPGERHIRVTLPGYDDASATVTVEKEQTVNANLTLEELPIKMAYLRNISNLWLTALDGTQQQEWKPNTFPIAISPDGSKMAEMDPYGIKISHIDGSLIRLIPHSAYNYLLPKDYAGRTQSLGGRGFGVHWLIDSKRLLITGRAGSLLWEVYISSNGKVFPHLTKQTLGFDISLSQKKIAEQIGRDIFISDLNGANSINVTKSLEGGGRGARWSFDGSKIAFISEAMMKRRQLWTASADGSDLKMVADDDIRLFAWSANTNEIAFRKSSSGIWISDANGQNERDTGVSGNPIWWGTLAGIGNQSGKIKLTSQPSGARVYLNGESTQEATPVILDALPGPNRVQIEYNSRRTDDVVWVKSNQTSTLNAKF